MYTRASNMTPTTITIWAILTLTLLAILISSIVVSVIYYRKSNVKWLSTKKLTLMATFLAIFLVQAFIFQPLLELPIKFSFDSITTIAVGFMFGPLEGILFGWVADSLRVLIHGWSYQLLPALMYPMIGLIASLFGILYRRSKDFSVTTSALIFQITVMSLFIVSLPLNYFLTDVVTNSDGALPTLIASTMMFVFTEIMFAILWFGNFDRKDITLVTILLLTAYSDRIMELVIRPFTQYYAGYEASYVAALYTRLLSSTYLIPTVTITSYILIRTTMYTLDIIQK